MASNDAFAARLERLKSNEDPGVGSTRAPELRPEPRTNISTGKIILGGILAFLVTFGAGLAVLMM